MQVVILNSATSGKRVLKIEFDRDKEEEIKERLKKAGFDVDARRYNF